MKILLPKFSVFLFLIFIGCGAREEALPPAAVRNTPSPQYKLRSAPAPMAEESVSLENVGAFGVLSDAAYSQPEQSIAPNLQPLTRMVIKTGSLNCEVANYENALAQIQQLAAQFGGYVVSSSAQVSAEDVKSGSVTLRLDAKNFDAALQALKQLAKKIESESVQGNDVTEEFYDLTARLENKRKAEKRYQEILASAKNTKDILEVEQALTNVREEIERMEGRRYRRRAKAAQLAKATMAEKKE